MYAYLKGGTSKISATEPNPGHEDKRYIILDFHRGDCNKLVPMSTVKSKKQGWLVESFDLNDVGVPGRSCSGGQGGGDTSAVKTVVDTIKNAAPK
jgi:hypothetical protein